MSGLAVAHELRLVGGIAYQHMAEAEQALVSRRPDELGVQQPVQVVVERRVLRLHRAGVAKLDHDLLEHRLIELTTYRCGNLGYEFRGPDRVQARLQQLCERLRNGVAGGGRGVAAERVRKL